jgi:hypothetical protein
LACLARRTAVRLAGAARAATLLTTTTIRAASGGGQRLRRRRPTCKVAGGLAGRQCRRQMLRALGALMHTARRAKRPPGMMPGLRSLPPFIPLQLLFNLFRLIFFPVYLDSKCTLFSDLQHLPKSLIVPAVLYFMVFYVFYVFYVLF